MINACNRHIHAVVRIVADAVMCLQRPVWHSFSDDGIQAPWVGSRSAGCSSNISKESVLSVLASMAMRIEHRRGGLHWLHFARAL